MNKRRKGKTRIILLLISIALLAGVGVAYANRQTLINSYYLITGSPREYYTYLEKYGFYELASALPDEASLIPKDYAYDIASNVVLHKKELNSALKTMAGFGLTDLEEVLGVSLDHISFNALLSSKDNILNERSSIYINNTKLLTTELFIDSPAHRLSMRFPELSDAYLTGSLMAGEASVLHYERQQSLLTSATVERIFRRYIELYFSHLGEVSLERRVPLSLDRPMLECNRITVTFTQKEYEELVLALLDTARTDEDILSLLPLLHITKDQFTQILARTKGLLIDRYSGQNQDIFLQIKLYADKDGQILRRELATFGGSSIGYTWLSRKEQLEYELHINHASTRSRLQVNGSNRRLEENNQGTIAIIASVPTLLPDTDLTLDITYEDVKRIVHSNRNYLEGIFTLSSKQLAGILITSEFDFTEKRQLNDTAIRLGTSPLITINSSGGFLEDIHVSLPEPNAIPYEFSEYQNYLSTINLNRYLSALSDTLNLDSGNIDLRTIDYDLGTIDFGTFDLVTFGIDPDAFPWISE